MDQLYELEYVKDSRVFPFMWFSESTKNKCFKFVSHTELNIRKCSYKSGSGQWEQNTCVFTLCWHDVLFFLLDRLSPVLNERGATLHHTAVFNVQ